MQKVVARIQAHPSRSHLHGLLADSLHLPAEIVLHASDPPSPWAGYQCCLSDLPDCTHLLIIQDDAVVCANFGAAVERIAEQNNVPVVLFLARLPSRIAGLALRAGKRRECYLDTTMRINDFLPVVAVLWPRQKAEEFLEWGTTHPLPGHPHPRSDDGAAGRWACLTKQLIRFTIPSLVQHPDMEPSLIGRQPAWGRDKGRVALMLAEDALAYPW